MPRTRAANRNLKLRGRQYYLVKRVPSDLIKLVGRSLIQEALKTGDVREARRLRDVRLIALERDWHLLRLKLAAPERLPDEFLRRAMEIRQASDLSTGERAELANDLAMEVYTADLVSRGYDPDRLDEEAPKSEVASLAYNLAMRSYADIAEAGEAYLAESELKDTTKKLYEGVFKLTAKEVTGSPSSIDKETARAFLTKVLKSGTKSKINNYVAALSSLWKHLELDPTIWTKPKGKPGKATNQRAGWTDEEVHKLIEAASGSLRLAIRIAAYTGARQGEIASLVYDAEKDHIVIVEEKTESGRRRFPCPDAIRTDVIEWVRAPMKKQAISDGFFRLRVGAVEQTILVDGKPYQRVFHSFRHTVITKLVEADVAEPMIQRIVGHARKGVTQGVYAKVIDPERLREYVNRVRYDEPKESEANVTNSGQLETVAK